MIIKTQSKDDLEQQMRSVMDNMKEVQNQIEEINNKMIQSDKTGNFVGLRDIQRLKMLGIEADRLIVEAGMIVELTVANYNNDIKVK